MKNKNVGFLIVGISFVMGIIIYLFNNALKEISSSSCSMGSECSMYEAINVQTWISVALTGFILIIGLFLILSKENEKIVIKKIKPEAELTPRRFSKKSLKNLGKEEAKIMNLLLENKGSMFQSDINDKAEFNKVKTTRILDGLEGRGLIERRRRGMTNMIILRK